MKKSNFEFSERLRALFQKKKRSSAKPKGKLDLSLSGLLNNKRMLQVVSIVSAFVIWASVSTGAAATETRTIRGVPIDVDVNGSLYQTLGLRVVDMNIKSVDVQVTGPRYLIGSMSSDDVRVSPVIAEVNEAGFYTLALRASLLDSSKEITVHSLSNTVVSATFDTFETRTFTLEGRAEALSVASGYIGGQPTLSMAVVTVHGPSKVLNTVETAVVHYSGPTDATRSFIAQGTVVLLDEEGKLVSTAELELSVEKVDVSVPVLKKKTVKTAVALSGAPEGFADRYLDITPEKIEIAGPADVVDSMDELTVATLDVARITESTELTFALVPGENILDVNGVGSVSVEVDYSKVKNGTFTISDIRLEGVESLGRYEASVETKSLENVTVYAASSLFGSLKDSNLYAVATLDATMAGAGQKIVTARVYSTKGDLVWAVGEYAVLVNITQK